MLADGLGFSATRKQNGTLECQQNHEAAANGEPASKGGKIWGWLLSREQRVVKALGEPLALHARVVWK